MKCRGSFSIAVLCNTIGNGIGEFRICDMMQTILEICSVNEMYGLESIYPRCHNISRADLFLLIAFKLCGGIKKKTNSLTSIRIGLIRIECRNNFRINEYHGYENAIEEVDSVITDFVTNKLREINSDDPVSALNFVKDVREFLALIKND